MTQHSVLNKSYPRVDAADKVAGHAQYASDVYLPGMLYCKVLKSPRRHARILSIDTSKAEALSGVRAIVTGRDFPNHMLGVGILKDHRTMALDKVHYIGEPLAAVAADDEITALEALELIEVEYEDLPAVVNPFEAMKDGSPFVHEDLPEYEGFTFAVGGNVCAIVDSDRGDVDKAFEEADYIFEDTFRSQSINQGYLEPMASVASIDPSGRITVWTSTQGPYQVRAQLAEVLDVPLSRIKIVPMELGGGFGSKLRLTLEIFPVLLAQKTGKPVKIIGTREEVFTLSGPRLPIHTYIKTGVMKDGTMVARESASICDMGAYLHTPNAGVSHAVGPYHIPNFRLRSYGVYTNKMWNGSYRASGVADVTFAVESHTDIVARKLGIDPIEFRLKNAVHEGDLNVQGVRLPKNGLEETLQAVKERLGQGNGAKAEGEGIGVALCEWKSGSGPSTASISINEDGTISVLNGSVDISGTDTVLAQIAAESLGVDMDQVIMAKRDTDDAPFTGPSGGSRIIYSQGKVVQMACEDARDKMMTLAAERLQLRPDALACSGGRIYVEDNPQQGFTLAQLARMSLTSKGGPIMGTAALSSVPYAPVFTTQGLKVKVDRETGQVKLLQMVLAQDVGTPINPMAVEGQMEGGAVQGIGRATTEEVVINSETGQIMNPSFTTYLMPLAADMPPVENVLVQVPTDDGPFGARAVAEPPGFGPPAAIANAIEDAVGVRIKQLPLTAEKILAALRNEPAPEIKMDVDFLMGRKGEGPGQAPSAG